jgi:hypothetical protein
MKNLIIPALMLFSVTSFAQTVSTPSIDTATNSETIYLAAPANYFKSVDGVWTAGIVATKISGTTAATAYLEVSADGTNYVQLNSRYGNYADSLAIGNVSGAQTKVWLLHGSKVAKARIKIVSTGTHTTQVKGVYIKN